MVSLLRRRNISQTIGQISTNDEKTRIEKQKAEAERDYVLMLLILTEMQLKRFKKQKSPTQGKGTPLSSDHNPLQPWPFAYAKYPIDVPYFNLLYRALYGFNYYKKIKKWSENASSKIVK